MTVTEVNGIKAGDYVVVLRGKYGKNRGKVNYFTPKKVCLTLYLDSGNIISYVNQDNIHHSSPPCPSSPTLTPTSSTGHLPPARHSPPTRGLPPARHSSSARHRSSTHQRPSARHSSPTHPRSANPSSSPIPSSVRLSHLLRTDHNLDESVQSLCDRLALMRFTSTDGAVAALINDRLDSAVEEQMGSD